ncbi:gmp synthase [Phlyctema vagabunda]|uniref:Gmp synthase n=1 Tax=Phlyctema vagabunda TaxID=108571 RepID=A0ABR4PN52_9HELO
MGKKKSPAEEAEEHISRPIATLKDPALFGPPPKNVNYHGGAALPNQITPDRRGLGAPLSTDEIVAKQRAKEAEEEAIREAEEAEARKPSIPYRANTTGLSTSHLPPPPGRKDGADGRSPQPSSAAKPKPPGLPPRLPPRQNSNPSAATPAAPPPYTSTPIEPEAHRGILNQGSLNRLGAAGVSVPGFGIGGKQPLPPPSRSPIATPPPVASGSQLGELQNRFSRFSSPKPEAPSQGTTFAQKQAALKTASSFRNDPSSVSLSDARSAASTANNFKERHGEQVKTGWTSANKLNTKYGIADKIGSYGAAGAGATSQAPPAATESQTASPGISLKDNTTGGSSTGLKKKPPPPPAKKPSLASTSGGESAPPPIPLSSKPKPPVSGRWN